MGRISGRVMAETTTKIRSEAATKAKASEWLDLKPPGSVRQSKTLDAGTPVASGSKGLSPIEGDGLAMRQIAADVAVDPVLAGGAPPWRVLTFVGLVLLPTLATFLYLIFVAAPQYVSEAKFVVRGNVERLGIESIGQMAALSALNNTQEAHVIADFIRSRDMAERVAADEDLSVVFSPPGFDVVFRLDPDASIDDLVRFWRRMVTTSVDATSGIVTVQVHAFSSDDAQRIAGHILKHSEELVNSFSEQMRAARLIWAEREVKEAGSQLETVLSAQAGLRGRERTLNALQDAGALTLLVAGLRQERAALATARGAASARLTADAPSIALMDEQIALLDAQIEEILTGLQQPSEQGPNLVAALTAFDMLGLRRELLTRRLSMAETAYTEARLAATRQAVFMDVFMPPTRAGLALFPAPWLMAFSVFGALLVIWGILVLYAESVSERSR